MRRLSRLTAVYCDRKRISAIINIGASTQAISSADLFISLFTDLILSFAGIVASKRASFIEILQPIGHRKGYNPIRFQEVHEG